jgi:hypothetical protein
MEKPEVWGVLFPGIGGVTGEWQKIKYKTYFFQWVVRLCLRLWTLANKLLSEGVG